MELSPYTSQHLKAILAGEDVPCYIISEIGSNFNGDLDLAKESIDASIACGANAVKFQTFKAEEFVANKELTYSYQTNDGDWITESQYDMFKRLELKDEWHLELLKYAHSKGVDFFSSAADRNAVDLLIELQVPVIKLASEDLINVALLEYLAAKKYPVILSTGMADAFEIRNAVSIFERHNSTDLAILHCVSQYPTPLENANLSRVQALSDAYSYAVGYSDHTEGWEAAMLSVAYGARIIEKHFTLDKNLPGPDHKMAADPSDLKKMIEMVRLAEKMKGPGSLDYHPSEEKARIEFRRSIVAAEPLKKGTRITESMLAYKRPGGGLKPYERDELIGKELTVDVPANEKILHKHIS